MDQSFAENLLRNPHASAIDGGMKFCSAIAQQSLDTRLQLGELPEVLRKASSVISRRQKLEMLQPFLVSTDRRERESVLEVFGQLPEMAPVLLEALNDRAWQVRAVAAKHLQGCKVPESVHALTHLLSDDVAAVRIVAAHSLGEMGAFAESALTMLRKAAVGPDVPSRDLEESSFLPFCNADLQRLSFAKAGEEDLSHNWIPGTYQLYAAEAHAKIRQALAQPEAAANLGDASMPVRAAQTMPAATKTFDTFMTNLTNDEEIDVFPTSDLITVVREKVPPMCDMAASILGTRGALEALGPLFDSIESESFACHHLQAVRAIFDKHGISSLDRKQIGILRAVLQDSGRSEDFSETVKLLSSRSSPEALQLLVDTVEAGGGAAEFAVLELRMSSFNRIASQHLLEIIDNAMRDMQENSDTYLAFRDLRERFNTYQPWSRGDHWLRRFGRWLGSLFSD